MSLTLIIGPMKSAKSLELITQAVPHEIAGRKVLFVHPTKNVRDEVVTSRLGLSKPSVKVERLQDITEDFDVIAVDEVHMFDGLTDHTTIENWVKQNKVVIASGLDLDYRGRLMTTIKRLLQLKPDMLIDKKSVCERCRSLNGAFTQILHDNNVLSGGLPKVVPEDGTYTYRTVCRDCFFMQQP